MPTAQAFIVLDPAERPHSTTAASKAHTALTKLATTEPPNSPRFVGYQPNTCGQRIAVYEADYPDDAA